MRRALKRVKKVLRHVLKTNQAPKNLDQLTKNVHAELKKQDALEEMDMQLLANIIEKCFLIKERTIEIGTVDLDAFILQVEEQVERISEIDIFEQMDRVSPLVQSAAAANFNEESKQSSQPVQRQSAAGRMKSWLDAKKGGGGQNEFLSLL